MAEVQGLTKADLAYHKLNTNSALWKQVGAVLHYEGNRPTHEIYELVTQKFNRKVNMSSLTNLLSLHPSFQQDEDALKPKGFKPWKLELEEGLLRPLVRLDKQRKRDNEKLGKLCASSPNSTPASSPENPYTGLPRTHRGSDVTSKRKKRATRGAERYEGSHDVQSSSRKRESLGPPPIPPRPNFETLNVSPRPITVPVGHQPVLDHSQGPTPFTQRAPVVLSDAEIETLQRLAVNPDMAQLYPQHQLTQNDLELLSSMNNLLAVDPTYRSGVQTVEGNQAQGAAYSQIGYELNTPNNHAAGMLPTPDKVHDSYQNGCVRPQAIWVPPFQSAPFTFDDQALGLWQTLFAPPQTLTLAEIDTSNNHN